MYVASEAAALCTGSKKSIQRETENSQVAEMKRSAVFLQPNIGTTEQNEEELIKKSFIEVFLFHHQA
jgi:hypothetical protein